MKPIEQMCQVLTNHKRIMWNVLLHATFFSLSLILSYNSYKEYVRGVNNIHEFPLELKIAIKATLPLSIFVFVALFVFFTILLNKKNNYLSFWQYTSLIIIQSVIVNLIFFLSGIHILIIQNLALFYLTIFLFVWSGLRRVIMLDTTSWLVRNLPQQIYRLLQVLQENMPLLREYCKKRPSVPYIVSFLALFMLCSCLLILNARKEAEFVANVAYFLFIVGVGIEIYYLIKCGKRGNRE